MSRASWILILILSIIIAPSLKAESRTLLREIDNNNRSGDQKVYGVELTATDFDGALNATPAAHAIVEFYAHWCPACRNYKPHFEKVARLFNGPDAVHPGIIFMTRVDCALKINRDLCDKFSVSHYPVLFWGPATELSSGWKPNELASEIRVIDDRRTAERLLNWINNQIGSFYGLDDEIKHLPSDISDPVQDKRETLDKVCEVVRKQLAIENNKPVTGESKFVDLGAEIVMGLAKEFGITVEEENAETITTFQDAAYLIQKLCSERSAY
ncbi:sulfhydryl oxidase 2-like isoform X2 [Hibiscus syriacus]|uniref:sulfhydryl oxidase 2-like isoform X2 n=1 Tax=Hibiscus syriacus TaxID=106335 RepID=UPI0019212946|nr:sulfhydryl oxidase 2-like isoform X2 [Hibiscus syriacus]